MVKPLKVLESKDSWNGMPVQQFDFLMTEKADPNCPNEGSVRVLVSARKNCAPYVKWVWAGTRREGWAEMAYRWLVAKYGRPLRVSDVCGAESLAFHAKMKRLGVVEQYQVDAVFKK